MERFEQIYLRLKIMKVIVSGKRIYIIVMIDHNLLPITAFTVTPNQILRL